MADLDCSAELDEAVKLTGTLLLNGFTLTGNPGFEETWAKIMDATVSRNGGDGVRRSRRRWCSARR